jgi:hypothetical protein
MLLRGSVGGLGAGAGDGAEPAFGGHLAPAAGWGLAPAAAGGRAAPAASGGIAASAADDHHYRHHRCLKSLASLRMTSLREFLTDLSIDPARLSAYLRDPLASMEAAGLEERARGTLRSGSAVAFWDMLLGRTSSTADHPPPPPAAGPADGRGSLVIVGTGIRTVGQLTLEAIAWIKVSDTVLYLIADPVAEDVVRRLNPKGAMSLRGYYGEGMPRNQSYEAMVQHILSCVRAGQRTCVAFYGHPGVFAYPSHESIRRARKEGYSARMLPGISAEDCLFADLGVDPAVNGCQTYEATDFLLHDRPIDTSSQLILWQIGVLGDWTYRHAGYNLGAMPMLVARLSQLYGAGHPGFIYEASMLPGLAPQITQIPLGSITPQYVTAGSTLYIPPVRASIVNRDVAAAMGVVR